MRFVDGVAKLPKASIELSRNVGGVTYTHGKKFEARFKRKQIILVISSQF